jgi:hypothetical protein
MSLKAVIGLGAVVAAAGAVVAAQLPELQRYMKVRKM